MDQEKFRQFLQAPPSGSSSGRVLGGATPRRGYVPPPTKEKKVKEAKPEFHPRKVKKSDGKYKDRAEARRAGLDNEFTEVEAMNQEFERRMQDEARRGEEDLADLEAKRAYLGGDADHSILVKGLDYALLAKNKADLEAEQGINDDDELEAAFASSSHPSVDPSSPNLKKRTREEILAAVQGKKRARAGRAGEKEKAAAAEEAEAEVKRLNNSKFKPIGFKEVGGGKKGKAGELGKDGLPKKLKKKKKKVVEGGEEGSMGPPAVPISSSMPPPPLPSSLPSTSAPDPSPALDTVPSTSKLPALPPSKAYAKPLVSAPDDDDDDIFGGVGDYEAPDSDSDDDTSKPSKPSITTRSTAPTSATSPPPITKTNWFNDAPEPSPSPPRIPVPLPSKQRVRPRSSSRSPSPDATSMRLMPLSGSRVPSVKDLLRMDEEAQAAAEKKAKKAAWRAKQGLAKQEDGDDDDDDEGGSSRKKKSKEQEESTRLNREFKEYESFVKAKEGGAAKG